jgi:NitT/TauT family transport system substrate-binding protein
MTKPKTFAAVIGALAFAALAAACGSSNKSSSSTSAPTGAASVTGVATKAATTTVKIGCTPSLGLVPQAYMMQNGLDQKNGIKLQCVNVQTGPQQAALLVSGGENITNLLPTNLYSLLDAGVPMVAFQPIQNGTGFDLLVRKGYPLPDQGSGWQGVMKDLAKARIGVPARGAAGEDLARGLFQAAGANTSSATYIATGTPATTIAALSNGSVDAAITFEPGISEALTHGIATQPFSLIKGQGPASMADWGGLFYSSTKSYATSHPAVLKDFATAYQTAVAWMTNPANHAQVVQFVENYLSVPANVAQTMVTNNLSSFTNASTIQASRYDAQGVFYHQLGAAKQAWPVSDYAFNVSS